MRRFLKWGVRLGVAFVLLIAVTLVGVRLYLSDARLAVIARDQLHKHVPFPVAFSGVELSLLHGIVLRDIDVGPPNPTYSQHAFTAREVRVGYKLGPLFDKRMEIDTICVIEPHAVLEEVNGKWNVVALGEAFGPTAPRADEPKDSSPPADLPVEVTLARFCIDGLSADVFSPAMTAHLDHLYVEARGSYRGLTSLHGEVEVDLGRSDARSRIDFAKPGLGEAHLQTSFRVAAKLADLNHVEASWDFLADELQGEMSGFALPHVPVKSKGQASADLSSESALIPSLTFALGEALTFSTTVAAQHIMHDPLLQVRNTKLAVDLGAVTSWAPAGMVPASVRGRFSIDQLDVDGTQSALTAQQGFALALAAKLDRLNVQHHAAALDKAALELNVSTQPGADVVVKLHTELPLVEASGSTVQDLTLDTEVKGPHELLVQKLPKPLTVKASVGVAQVTSGANVVRGTTLSMTATTKDLAGNDARVEADLGIANLQSTVPKQGTFAFPVQAHFAVARQGPKVRFDGSSVAVGEWLRLAVAGRVDSKAKGAIDTDLKLEVADIALGAMLASLPEETRLLLDGRQVDGKVGASLRVFGVIPADVGKAFAGEPLDLAFAGTPFAVDFALRWKDLSSHDASARVDGARGTFTLSTRPKRVELGLQLGATQVTAGGAQIDALEVGSKVLLADSRGSVDFTQSAGAVQQPTLAAALTKVSSSAHLDYVRGGDATLEHLRIELPSLGASLQMKGRVGEIDDVITERRFADPTLGEIDGEVGLKLSLDTRAPLSPLRDQVMSVVGQLGLSADASLKHGLIEVSGALTAKDFSFEQPGMAVHKMAGRLPFLQQLRLGQHGEPLLVWSELDILKQNPRIAYYQELRSYRGEAYGLTIAELISGPHKISGIELHGRLERSAFFVDHYSMALLTGDISGQLALAFGSDKIFRAAMTSTFSNLDLSVMSKTPPGPDSQISGNMTAGITWGDKNRNLDATFNLTRLGRDVLVQALLALDPEEKDEKTRENRKLLERTAIKIDLLEASIRYNTLKANLYYSMLLTTLTLGLYKPIPNDLVPRLNIKAQVIDSLLAPPLDKGLANVPGWATDTSRVEP